MRPVGLSSNNLTQRFMRHFNLISIESFIDEDLRTIYTPFIESHFLNYDFPKEYFKYTDVKEMIIFCLFLSITLKKIIYLDDN